MIAKALDFLHVTRPGPVKSTTGSSANSAENSRTSVPNSAGDAECRVLGGLHFVEFLLCFQQSGDSPTQRVIAAPPALHVPRHSFDRFRSMG